MKGHPIAYSRRELAWLSANRGLVISDYAAQFNAKFGRDVAAANLHALRKRNGWRSGRTGCFVKGITPHNKGKKCRDGEGGRHQNARKTQFTKGGRTGKAALLYKPIGTERLNKDGYRERKIHDGMPLQSRWRLLHLVEWESVNGPIPEGMVLKCKGDRLNCDPSNWEMIPRALLPRLGGRYGRNYDGAPDDLKPFIMATTKLEHAVREASLNIHKGAEKP